MTDQPCTPPPCPPQETIHIEYLHVTCVCGRHAERTVVLVTELGETVHWVCPEHGLVAERTILTHGELDLGVTE